MSYLHFTFLVAGQPARWNKRGSIMCSCWFTPTGAKTINNRKEINGCFLSHRSQNEAESSNCRCVLSIGKQLKCLDGVESLELQRCTAECTETEIRSAPSLMPTCCGAALKWSHEANIHPSISLHFTTLMFQAKGETLMQKSIANASQSDWNEHRMLIKQW